MSRRGHLGDLEELVLLAVLRQTDQAYGGSVRRELADKAGRRVALGTVYVTLMRLEEKGLVRSWLGEPSAVRGGKAKRLYEVRPEGVEALQYARRVREDMWQGLDREDGAEAHAR